MQGSQEPISLYQSIRSRRLLQSSHLKVTTPKQPGRWICDHSVEAVQTASGDSCGQKPSGSPCSPACWEKSETPFLLKKQSRSESSAENTNLHCSSFRREYAYKYTQSQPQGKSWIERPALYNALPKFLRFCVFSKHMLFSYYPQERILQSGKTLKSTLKVYIILIVL